VRRWVSDDIAVTITITPTAASPSVVRGTLYLDTWDSGTGVSGQEAAIPYTYTVA
jgi:hypothetical protein